MIADYAASAERITEVLSRLRARAIYAAGINALPVRHHTPTARTMTAFLDHLDTSYGGVLGWLSRHGFGAGDVVDLRTKLLAR